MLKRIAAIAFLLVLGSGALCAQNPTEPAVDHPSNGVLEMTLSPVIQKVWVRHPQPQGATLEDDVWRGQIKVTLRNASGAQVHVVEDNHWWLRYGVEVLDSSGAPAALTEYGIRELGARGPGPYVTFGGAAIGDLLPSEADTFEMNLALIWQIQPGQAYTIRVRRPLKGEDLDGLHKPIQGDLAATLVIAAAAQ